MDIRVPVSPGELIDKITILEIKSARITEAEKKKNVDVELEILVSVAAEHVPETREIRIASDRLREVNEALWKVEDDLRLAERQGDFGDRFVLLARSVYTLNDQRAALKKKINVALGSRIVEEKSYEGGTPDNDRVGDA